MLPFVGATARGEDDMKSDLDLPIISKKKNIDLSRFEAKLKREINYIIYTPAQWNEKAKKDKPFYDRIIVDGIVLFGEFPVI